MSKTRNDDEPREEYGFTREQLGTGVRGEYAEPYARGRTWCRRSVGWMWCDADVDLEHHEPKL